MVMKKILCSASIIAALVLSQAASADSRSHRRGYNDYGYSYAYGGHNYRDGHRNNYRTNYRRNHRANSYHHGFRDRRYRSSYHAYYGNRHSRRGHYDSGSFVGGLVLGSLFSYPRYSSRNHETVIYRNVPATRTREIVYVDKSESQNTAPVTSGRRLLRDLEGNCFERLVGEKGDEIRLQLNAGECNF